jgi:transcription initiation factor TFIIH subunit 1
MSVAQQVAKRAKYKTTVKDPGTPGVIYLVLSLLLLQSIPFTLPVFLTDEVFFFTLQTQEKLIFKPNDPTSKNKLDVDFRLIKSTYQLLFM